MLGYNDIEGENVDNNFTIEKNSDDANIADSLPINTEEGEDKEVGTGKKEKSETRTPSRTYFPLWMKEVMDALSGHKYTAQKYNNTKSYKLLKG